MPRLNVSKLLCLKSFLLHFFRPAFTDELNRALLQFNINETIERLNNISSLLMTASATDLQRQVDDISQNLSDIQDIQIPTIQDQIVSWTLFRGSA